MANDRNRRTPIRPTSPRGSRDNTDIIITEISPNSEPEWIEIFNAGNTPVPLSGWKFVGYNGYPNWVANIVGDDFNIIEDVGKWIDFDLCYQGQGGWTGDADYCNEYCVLPPGKFLVLYESPSPVTNNEATIYDTDFGVDTPEQMDFPYNVPPCYIMGFNDSSQPANQSSDCGDNDCSHINGDGDLIALFSTDNLHLPTTGKWNGDVTNAIDYVYYHKDNVNYGDKKSMSLKDPYSDNSHNFSPLTDNWIPRKFYEIIDGYTEASPGYPTTEFELNFIVEEVTDSIGDVNMDGVVNIIDIMAVIDHILDGPQLTEAQQLLADIDQDGQITIADIVLIVQQILGATPQQQSAIMNEVRRLLRPGTQQTSIRPGDTVRDINPN